MHHIVLLHLELKETETEIETEEIKAINNTGIDISHHVNYFIV